MESIQFRLCFPTFGFIALWATVLISSALCKCFFPSGETVDALSISECPNTSSCCSLNRVNPAGGDYSDGSTKDECLPNGVCQNRFVYSGVTYTWYWRDYCQNRDWNSNSNKCLDICTEETGDDGTQITPCDGFSTSERWCCGNTTDCCTEGNPDVHVLAATLGTFSATPTTSPVFSTYSASPTSTSGPPNTNHGGLSTGAKAGIGVGAIVGALLLLGLGFYIAKSLQWKRAAAATRAEHEYPEVRTSEQAGGLVPGGTESSLSYGLSHNMGLAHEVPNDAALYEAPNRYFSGRRPEMP